MEKGETFPAPCATASRLPLRPWHRELPRLFSSCSRCSLEIDGFMAMYMMYRTTGQIRSIIIQDSQQLFGLCSFLFNFVLLFLSFFVPFVPLSSSRQDPMHFCCHVHQLSICMRSANELKSHWYLAQPWFSHLAGRMLQT